MLRLFLVLSLAVVAVPAATSAPQAASFDCSKASSFFETAICGDPPLSASDETLAVAYATAIGGLSREAADRLRAEQRRWLDFASRVCTTDGEPMNRDNFPIGEEVYHINCLLSEFSSRVEVLESSRMIEGLRIVPVSAYAVFIDPETGTGDAGHVGNQSYSAPRIDSQSTEAKTFNALIDAELGDFAITLVAAGMAGNGLPTGSDEGVSLAIKEVLPSRITVERNDSFYGHGAAHGQYSITYLHFLRNEQRALTAEDMFVGETWKLALVKEVTDEIHRQIAAEDLMLGEGFDLTPTITNPRNWDFTDRALIVQFQPYEISAYAYGAPTISVPWTALTAILNENAATISSGY